MVLVVFLDASFLNSAPCSPPGLLSLASHSDWWWRLPHLQHFHYNYNFEHDNLSSSIQSISLLLVILISYPPHSYWATGSRDMILYAVNTLNVLISYYQGAGNRFSRHYLWLICQFAQGTFVNSLAFLASTSTQMVSINWLSSHTSSLFSLANCKHISFGNFNITTWMRRLLYCVVFIPDVLSPHTWIFTLS